MTDERKVRLARNFNEQCSAYRWKSYRCQLVEGHTGKHEYCIARFVTERRVALQKGE